MNPELLKAVKERISLGHSQEAISAALEAAGYDRATIDQVYQEARAEHERTAIPLAEGQGGEQFTPSAKAAELPSGFALFKAGWRYMLTRLDIVAAIGGLLALLTVVEFLFADDRVTLPAGASILIAVASVVGVVVYLLVVLGSLYIVMRSDEERVSISAGVAWARSHIWGFLWVSLLTFLVVLGGLLLFIIPGLIVSLYLYFAQYVFVKEGARGMTALTRSVQLVSGKWWALFLRFLVLGVLSFLVMMPLLIVVEVVDSSVNHVVANLVVAVLVQLLAAAVTVITLYAVYTLYCHLSTARPVGSESPVIATWKYKALAGLGVVMFIVLVILGVLGATLEEAISEQSQGMLSSSLAASTETAEAYRADNGSYAGVCGEVATAYEAFGTVVCNDSAEAWAMSLESEMGEWCVDSTGFMKAVPANLGERTACLAL